MKLRIGAAVALLAATGGQAVAADEESAWRANVALYRYAVPEQNDFTMAVAGVDYRSAHLEGRYNYEAFKAGSLFAGFTVAGGERVKLALTPMFGVVFGELHGAIPALRDTVAWWRLDLYTESELVIDFDEEHESFFYDWSELGFSPGSWLRFGIVAQRSRVFLTPLDIQRGIFVGATYRIATVAFYEFNLGWTHPSYVASLSLAFQ